MKVQYSLRGLILGLLIANVFCLHAQTDSTWSLTGNSGTSAATNFIGTTDANDFLLKANNTEILRLLSDGTNTFQVNNGTGNNVFSIIPNSYSMYFLDASGNPLLQSNSGNFTASGGWNGTDFKGSILLNASLSRSIKSGSGIGTYCFCLVGSASLGTVLPLQLVDAAQDNFFQIQAAPIFTGSYTMTAPILNANQYLPASVNGLFPDSTGNINILNSGMSGSGWSLSGNSGTTEFTNYIGTSDDVITSFGVNGIISGYLQDDDNSNGNTTYGYNSMNDTTGDENSAFGAYSLNSNASAIYTKAGGSSTAGSSNVAVGAYALTSNGTGNANSSIGNYSLSNNSTGSFNVALGTSALESVNSGSNNIAVGFYSGALLGATSSNNIYIGSATPPTIKFKSYYPPTGINSSATNVNNSVSIGNDITPVANQLSFDTTIHIVYLPGLPTAAGNVLTDIAGDGHYSSVSPGKVSGGSGWSLTGTSGTTAFTNFIGTTDDVMLTFGVNSVQSGFLQDDDNSNGSTAFGYHSMSDTTGSENAAFGTYALRNSNGSISNVAIGAYSLDNLDVGSNNTAIGYGSGTTLGSNSNYNIYIGHHDPPTTLMYAAVSLKSSLANHSTVTPDINNSISIGNDVTPVANQLSFDASIQTIFLPGMGSSGAGGAGYVLTDVRGDGHFTEQPPSALLGGAQGGGNWSLTGNQGTIPGTDFLGTTDAQDLVVETNAIERMRILSTGKIGIGTPTPAYDLDVNGIANIQNQLIARNNLLVYNSATSGMVQPMIVLKDDVGEENVTPPNGPPLGGLVMGSAYGGAILFGNNFYSSGIANRYLQLGRVDNNYSFSAALTIGSENLNVGIGTATPNPLSTLHVHTGTNQNLLFLPATTFLSSLQGLALQSTDDNFNPVPLDIQSSCVVIGTPTTSNPMSSGYLLDVKGNIRANQLTVNTTGMDKVFDSSYKLEPLPNLEIYLQENHHLPGIAPATEMEKNGIEIGQSNALLLQKVEELTLYIIQLNKKIGVLEKQKR